MNEDQKKKKLPTISVVIPMRNEEDHIAACLQSVVDQDYPAELLEVLIVDGVSSDGSRDIVSRFQQNYPYIRRLTNERKATTYALNLGITESNGEIVVRVDAHCTLAPNYIRACVDALQQSGADNVGGLMRPRGRTPLEKVIALAMSSRFGVGGGKFHYFDRELFVDTVYLGAYRREVFDRIGFYDEEAHYSEDDELNYRLIKSGGRILLSPKIHSEYSPRGSLFTLWKQFYNYGFGKARTFKKHGRTESVRHLAPPLFVLSLGGCLILLTLNPLFGWVFVTIVVAYFMSATFVAARISIRSGWKSFVPLPIVFLTIHLAYGLGFLVNILRLYLFNAICTREALS